MHIGIEPHQLAHGSLRREAYIPMWLPLSEVWMTMKRRSGQHIQVALAIAFGPDVVQVHHAGVTQPASPHLQNTDDPVVPMDHRNRAPGVDGIVSHGQDEIECGQKMAQLTFDGRTPAEVVQEMAQLLRAFDPQCLARQRADRQPLLSPLQP